MSESVSVKKEAEKLSLNLDFVTFSDISDAVEFYEAQLPGRGEEAVLALINRAAHAVQSSIIHAALRKGKNEAAIQVLLSAHSPQLPSPRKVRWTVRKAREAIVSIIPTLRAGKLEVMTHVVELIAMNNILEAVDYLTQQNISLPSPDIEAGE